MKKILIMVLTVCVAFVMVLSSDAKNKKQSKASPCVKKCGSENYKCRQLAKKAPAAKKKAEYAKCKKNRVECLKSCKTAKVNKTKKVEPTVDENSDNETTE